MKNKPSEELLEVAQEITFAKALASNDNALRDKALKRLKKWILSKSEASKSFSEDGLVRLWRGLFYNVWMSDKPLVQEQVVEGVSNLVHCFNEYSDALAFIMCFFQTLSETWFGLDSHRFDKYLMLVRRFLRQTFMVADKYDWQNKHVLELVAAFEKVFSKAPLGFLMHICEIYLEELAKVSKGDLDKNILTEIIKPFGHIMSKSSDVRLIKHIGDFIYLYLLKQSDLGIKHQLKFDAWKRMGCPGGNINMMQEVEINSEEEEIDEFNDGNVSLDARAGHVDVILPHLKFDAGEIINFLTVLKKNSATSTRARKRLSDIINKFKTFERGKYPLGIHKVDVAQSDDEDEAVEDAALDLMEEEMEIYQRDEANQTSKSKQKAAKKHDRSNRGEWLVTPTKENKPQISNITVWTSNDLHNKWHVSSSVPSEANDHPNSTCSSAKVQGTHQRNKIKHKRKNNNANNLSKTSPTTELFQKIKDGNAHKNKKVKTSNITNDWGNVSWDDEQEMEIILEPKKKLRRHSDVLPLTQSAKMNSRKKSSYGMSSTGKKVEFVLNRNSIQDEEDYKRCLKRKPIIKFDGGLQPALGVLKSTPFSSPLNPFILPTSKVQ